MRIVICHSHFGERSSEDQIFEDRVRPGKTGWHCEPGDGADRTRAVSEVFRFSAELGPMRRMVRDNLENYAQAANHEVAMQVCVAAIRRRKGGASEVG